MQEPFDISGGSEERVASESAREVASCSSSNISPPLHDTVTAWLDHGKAGAANVPAVRFNGIELNYGQLDRMCNRIAYALMQNGVRSGDRVGLCLDRSIEMVAALIGILKCGAAYVPFDADYPRERLNMMQEDAQMRLMLVHEACMDRFKHASCPVLIWETFIAEVDQAPGRPPTVTVNAEDAAYVIFTSGSTGRPKGIAMPHRALSNLIEWQLERKTFKPAARVMQYSSISFDVSFQEIATTLASGGTLHLISNDDRKDPRTLLEKLLEYRTERLFLPYVALRGMIEAVHLVGVYPEDLKEVITAGEQLRIDAPVRRFFDQIDGVSLDNQYGPSETHVITAHLLEGDPAAWPDLPPIGTPLKNCIALIMDEFMKPVAAGETGELYLGGRNLASGYLLDKGNAGEAFITNPFNLPDYPILYKTGDLAACDPDGSIRFMGRADHQIKIRGHRIEPGEINNAASTFPGMGQCLTHAAPRDDGVLQLVTYYTSSTGAKIDSVALRRHLDSKLPEYMVPAFLIELDEIPYTPSGKMDLKSLPKPKIDHSRYAESELLYESESEVALAGIWIRLLGLERIPRTADFFELGGDSLRAVTLFLNIQEYFGRELPLSTLAHSSTIAKLAKLIDGVAETPDLTGYRCLQLLRQGMAGGIPLFLIHGGKGNVLVFNDFAHRLDPMHPVYAFQWSGWDGSRGERSIPEMAQEYVAEIRRFNGDRPCRLGGNCVGGLIAIEIAKLLTKEGIEVMEPLLVWDAPNLHSESYRRREPWGSGKQQAALERVKEGLLQRTPNACREDVVVQPEPCSPGFIGFLQRLPYLRRLVQRSKAFLRIMPAYRAHLSGQRVPMDVREHYCIKIMLAAVRRHVGEPYAGDILYFRSCSILGRDFGIPGWWDDLHLGFEELCGGHFEAHVVGGKHNKVIDAAESAKIVNQYMDIKNNE